MKFRFCVPVLVPGTTAQGVQDVPLNFVKRIELAGSVLITNSHRFVPSVAPKRPPLTVLLLAPTFVACPVANAGGACWPAIAAQLFVATAYDAPLIAVPAAFVRNA